MPRHARQPAREVDNPWPKTLTWCAGAEPVILEIIAAGTSYGYEIGRAVQEASGGELLAQEGTLYPALHRLQKRGYLAATWKTSPEGRKRKHYRLTAEGRPASRGIAGRMGRVQQDGQSHPGDCPCRSRLPMTVESSPAAIRRPNRCPSRLADDIAAEIADHLASAAGDLKRRGAADDEAARLALARFGDVARVTRQCWWVHKREEVMFRTAEMAVGPGGDRRGRGRFWRLAIAAELCFAHRGASPSNSRRSPPRSRPCWPSRAAQIAGQAYLGDPSVPAKDVEIQVFRFSAEPSPGNSPGAVARRVRTDAEGRFESGNLQLGDYCLLGPLLDSAGNAKPSELLFSKFQSRPLYLTAGAGKETIDLTWRRRDDFVWPSRYSQQIDHWRPGILGFRRNAYFVAWRWIVSATASAAE